MLLLSMVQVKESKEISVQELEAFNFKKERKLDPTADGRALSILHSRVVEIKAKLKSDLPPIIGTPTIRSRALDIQKL